MLDLFGVVALRTDQISWDGQCVPAGASGTVVDILKGGEAYTVDVVDPFDAVVTVTAHNLDVIIDHD
ncbi:hypothetical protein ASG52_01030 [Methylobacterium sp. Leaf456]|nr:hypothetical protein ASG52_01030 [Methylobacterium sp. Leaf456]